MCMCVFTLCHLVILMEKAQLRRPVKVQIRKHSKIIFLSRNYFAFVSYVFLAMLTKLCFAFERKVETSIYLFIFLTGKSIKDMCL